MNNLYLLLLLINNFIFQRLVTLGEETINTSMFTQLDNGQVYLVTDTLMRFCLVGESLPTGRAVKQLRLAVFGPQVSQALDYNVRIYTVEDTTAALQVRFDKLFFFNL